MMNIFGMALAGLLIVAEQGGSTASAGNAFGPKYHRYDFESACGSSVFRVRFRNVPGERSRIDHVLIDGRPVAGAAKKLDRFAARGVIDRIGIMHCGTDPRQLVFRGIMKFRKSESQPTDNHETFFFRIVPKGKGWRISID
jgi:hypothetical protein